MGLRWWLDNTAIGGLRGAHPTVQTRPELSLQPPCFPHPNLPSAFGFSRTAGVWRLGVKHYQISYTTRFHTLQDSTQYSGRLNSVLRKTQLSTPEACRRLFEIVTDWPFMDARPMRHTTRASLTQQGVKSRFAQVGRVYRRSVARSPFYSLNDEFSSAPPLPGATRLLIGRAFALARSETGA